MVPGGHVRADQLVAELHLLLLRLTAGEQPAALEQVCVAACRVLPAAVAATVALLDEDGRQRPVASSDPRARQVASLQCRLEEGPATSAVEDGRPVVVDDLEGEADRWPDFAPAAMLADLRAVVAFPLYDGDTPIGSLVLYGREALSDSGLLAAAEVLAAAAASIAVVGRRQERSQEVIEQLERALEHRVVVEQAKGMLAERLGVAPDEAYERLRRHARDRNRRVAELARAVLAGEDPVAR
jgi:GAF domain-containing protein